MTRQGALTYLRMSVTAWKTRKNSVREEVAEGRETTAPNASRSW